MPRKFIFIGYKESFHYAGKFTPMRVYPGRISALYATLSPDIEVMDDDGNLLIQDMDFFREIPPCK